MFDEFDMEEFTVVDFNDENFNVHCAQKPKGVGCAGDTCAGSCG